MHQFQPQPSRFESAPFEVLRQLHSRDEICTLGRLLVTASAVAVGVEPCRSDPMKRTVLTFTYHTPEGVLEQVALDCAAFEPFIGRGYVGRVQQLLAPLVPFFAREDLHKFVYGAGEKRELKAFCRKFLAEPQGVIDLEQVAQFVRPDLPTGEFSFVLFAVTGLTCGLRERGTLLHCLAHELKRATRLATPGEIPARGACAAILERERERLAISRESGAVQKYWGLRLHATRILKAIEQKLSLQRTNYDPVVITATEFGSATVSCKEVPRFDHKKIRMRYPELIPALECSITKERLLEAFRARGMSRKQAEAVVETLYLEVGTGSPRAEVHPAYQTLYQELPEAAVEPSWKIHPMVTSRKGLERVVRTLQTQKSFSLDTETWGPPGEPPDRDLCLIQIGIRPEQNRRGEVFLIQVKQLEEELRRDGRSANPLEPLRAVLESEQVQKVAHHKQFEEAQFRKYGIELAATTDTKTLVKELRPDLPSYTLRACCYEILGVVLSKEQQLSDWNAERLTSAQIGYAALDAEYTLRLFDEVERIRRETEQPIEGEVRDLLWQLIQTQGDAIRIGRTVGLGNEYWAHGVAANTIEEQAVAALKKELTQLPDQAELLYSDVYGSLFCRRPTSRELDIDRLRADHSDVAEAAAEYTIREDVVRGALFERGLSPEEIDREILDLTSSLKQSTTLKVVPRYDLYQW